MQLNAHVCVRIDVKTLTTRIKNVKKRWIKNVIDKLTKLIKPNEKFPVNILS